MKSLIKILIPTLLIALIIAIGYDMYKETTPKITDPLKIIPKNSAIILQINNIKEIPKTLKQTNIWNQLLLINQFELINKELDELSLLLSENSIFNTTKMVVSLHKTGPNNNNILYSTNISLNHLKDKNNIIQQLKEGVPLVVKDKMLTPNTNKNYSVGDLITGFGVAESVIHFYNIYSGDLKGKKVIIQGWGNVAGAAAYYLSNAGAKIIGIIDKLGGVLNLKGFSTSEINSLLENRSSNFLETPNLIPFEKINDIIWKSGAEIFIPAAASRLITKEQLEDMITNGLELII